MREMPADEIRAFLTTGTRHDELRRWATRIGARYMGADRAEEFGKRNGAPGELVVRLRPTKIVADLDVTG